MNTLKFIIVFILVIFCLSTGATEKLRILDRGLDGDKRTYLVTCPDGNLSSVVQKFAIAETSSEPPDHMLRLSRGNNLSPTRIIQVCIYPHKGKDICLADWDLDTAARASCP